MQAAFVAMVLLVCGVLTSCNVSPEIELPHLRSEATADPDDPKSLAGLTSITAETKTNEAGLITFIDVSERDDISDATFRTRFTHRSQEPA